MIIILPFILPLFIGGTLVLSGVQKLRTPLATIEVFEKFRIPICLQRRSVALAFSFLELVIGCGIILGSTEVRTVSGILSVFLFLIFTLISAVVVIQKHDVSCNCFGSLSGNKIGKTHLVRNCIFLSLAIIFSFSISAIPSITEVLLSFSLSDIEWLFTCTLAVAIIFILQCSGRLSEDRMIRKTQNLNMNQVEDVGALAGAPIPPGELRSSNDRSIQIGDLISANPQLLIFIKTNCLPCRHLLGEVENIRAALRGHIEVQIVSLSTYSQLKEDHPSVADRALYDMSGMYASILGLQGTPGAFLLGRDGNFVAGPAYGIEEILDLKFAIIEAIDIAKLH